MPICAQEGALELWRRLADKHIASRTLSCTYYAPVKTDLDGKQDKDYKKSGVKCIAKAVAENVYCKYWQSFVQSIPDARRKLARLQSRLLINTAGSIIENAGVSLEFACGVPIIPGSAVKGATRRYALALLQEESAPDRKAALLQDILAVFGCTRADFKADSDLRWAMGSSPLKTAPEDRTGGVCFLQAVPETDPEIGIDVLTPHHQEYMANPAAPPHDAEKPVPIYFPVIEATQPKPPVFCFTLCSNSGDPESARLVDLASDWMEKSLSLLGIGAKTSAGYGQFQFIDESQTDATPEMREAFEFIVKKKKLDEIFSKGFSKYNKSHPERIQALLSLLQPDVANSRREAWKQYRDTPQSGKNWEKTLKDNIDFAMKMGIDLTSAAD